MRGRDVRRHQAETAKARARRQLKGRGMSASARQVGKLAHTPAPCSCGGCGNPRRHTGCPTRQEELAEQRLHHQAGRVSRAPPWLTSAILSLARGILDRCDSSALPVLADALEEAGCTDPGLLERLRAPRPNLSGWRALEMLLGIE